jgi:hypothetical protein
MALGDFQRALADMTLDARLAAAVRNRGGSALAGYALTDRECQRLQSVAQQEGMSLNCSLAREPIGSIHDATMTCVLLGPRLREVLDNLFSGRRPDNYQLAGEETAFAELVDGAIANGTLTNEYLEEIFRYERICWEMAMELRLRDAAAMEGRTRTACFRHDPGPLLDALAQDQPPPAGLPVGDYEVTVRVTNGDLVAEWDVSG